MADAIEQLGRDRPSSEVVRPSWVGRTGLWVLDLMTRRPWTRGWLLDEREFESNAPGHEEEREARKQEILNDRAARRADEERAREARLKQKADAREAKRRQQAHKMRATRWKKPPSAPGAN